MLQNWKKRLDRAISSARNDSRVDNKPRFFSVSSLIEITKAPSTDKLLDAVERKVDSGEIDILYRIISPETKTTIAEFEKLIDVPSTIYDDTAGYEINIDPLSNLEVLFRVSRK